MSNVQAIYVLGDFSDPGSDAGVDLSRAGRWLRWVASKQPDAVVLAPWMHEPRLPDDADPDSREAGMRRCMVVARLCDEVWLVGGFLTEEMRRIAHAGRLARDFTALGVEPPGAAT